MYAILIFFLEIIISPLPYPSKFLFKVIILQLDISKYSLMCLGRIINFLHRLFFKTTFERRDYEAYLNIGECSLESKAQ